MINKKCISQGGRAGRPVKKPRVGVPDRGGAVGAAGTASQKSRSDLVPSVSLAKSVSHVKLAEDV